MHGAAGCEVLHEVGSLLAVSRHPESPDLTVDLRYYPSAQPDGGLVGANEDDISGGSTSHGLGLHAGCRCR